VLKTREYAALVRDFYVLEGMWSLVGNHGFVQCSLVVFFHLRCTKGDQHGCCVCLSQWCYCI